MFWENNGLIEITNFKLKCNTCSSEYIIVKSQVYLDQGYLPTKYRKIIKCKNCGKEEVL